VKAGRKTKEMFGTKRMGEKLVGQTRWLFQDANSLKYSARGGEGPCGSWGFLRPGKRLKKNSNGGGTGEEAQVRMRISTHGGELVARKASSEG